MLARATVTINLASITENTRTICERLPGIGVVGVTKVTCGSPEIARAMLLGGVTALADSRLENLERLRNAGLPGPFWLLRAPTPVLADAAVALADVSLESEIITVEALNAAAAATGRRHAILVMVDLGDLREGMLPADLPAFLARVSALEHVDILGIGTSLTCYGAVVPSEENLGELVALARAAERQLGHPLVVSGGMSSSIDLAAAGRMPAGVTNLRIGESILLGVSTVTRRPLPGLHTDAITLAAPVIECARKPSAPRGEIAQDAMGGTPRFADRGNRLRAICAIGQQDAVPAGLAPLTPGVEVLGASSDHLILDAEAMDPPPCVGDAIRFVPNYAATLRLFASAYVEKEYE